jgi:hypothetical protein
VDQVRSGDRLGLGAVQMPANANGGRSPLSANHTTSFLLVSAFGSGAYSAKLASAGRLPTYRFRTRNSPLMASWLV